MQNGDRRVSQRQYWLRVCARARNDTRAAYRRSGAATVVSVLVAILTALLSTYFGDPQWSGIKFAVGALAFLGALLLAGCVVLTVMVLLAPARLADEDAISLATVRTERNERVASLERDLSRAIAGRPRITLDRFYSDVRTLGQVNSTRVGVTHWCHAVFKNDPAYGVAGSAAKDVAAEIVYYDADGATLCDVTGRWGNTDQPAARNPLLSLDDLATVNLGPSLRAELNVAFMYDGADCAYAFSNEACRAPGWMLPGLRIPNESFYARVRLRSENVDECFWFRLSRPAGSNPPLWITTAESPAWAPILPRLPNAPS